MTEKDKAKRVIVELARQSTGDAIDGKTRLYKAFYFAHLYYANSDAPGYLTEWPIVRMPHGPGIDDFRILIDELESEGRIRSIPLRDGPYNSTKFIAVGKSESELSELAAKAIGKAAKYVSGKTAAELSGITHVKSRSWVAGSDGDHLNIYLDILSDADQRIEGAKNIQAAIAEAFSK